MENVALRRKYVKDMDYPISVYSDPYFYSLFRLFVSYYDGMLESYINYNRLIESIGEENVYDAIVKTSHNIITKIQDSEQWKSIDKQVSPLIYDMDKKLSQSDRNWKKAETFIMDNLGYVFIELGWKHANFQSMKYLLNGSVMGALSYDELIRKSIKNPYLQKHFIMSKRLRQVIFGNLNPKLQQRVQKLLNLNLLFDFPDHIKDKIYSVSHDSIIFKLSNFDDIRGIYREICENIEQSEIRIDLHKRVYTLYEMGYSNFMIQEFDPQFNNCRPKFRNVPKQFMPQVICHYYGIPMEDDYLVFYHEGQLAKWINPIFLSN